MSVPRAFTELQTKKYKPEQLKENKAKHTLTMEVARLHKIAMNVYSNGHATSQAVLYHICFCTESILVEKM